MAGGVDKAIGDAMLILACVAIIGAGALLGGFWFFAFSLWAMFFPLAFNPCWSFILIPISGILSIALWQKEKHG